MINIYHDDCFNIFDQIESESIDMILCDLPYGTTQCAWDSVLPLNDYIKVNGVAMFKHEFIAYMMALGVSSDDAKHEFNENKIHGLWSHYKRVIKDNGAIVLTAAQPFTSALVMSNLPLFRYEWIYEKPAATGFLNAKKQPLRAHESVLVFYKKQPTYNPQKTKGHKRKMSSRQSVDSDCYGKAIKRTSYDSTDRYPRTVQIFNSDKQKISLHPTQKPVALCEYLIKTYTNKGNLVLDNCMGSGTTGIACINTGRKFIGIEKDKNYFNIASARIEEHQKQGRLFA